MATGMATVYDQKKEDQMKKNTATLLDVAKRAHRDGNRNVHTADGALLNVEGLRNGWVTLFRNGIGPDFIHPDVAATMTVTDLGRSRPNGWDGHEICDAPSSCAHAQWAMG